MKYKGFKCPICGEIAKSLDELDVHMRAWHWISLWAYFGVFAPNFEEKKRRKLPMIVKKLGVKE